MAVHKWSIGVRTITAVVATAGIVVGGMVSVVGSSEPAGAAAGDAWDWIQQPPTGSARGVAVDDSGNSYVTGSTVGTLPGSPEANAGGSDAFVAKYDTNGTQLWVHQLGSVGHDFGTGIGVDAFGNSYVTGSTVGTLPGSPEANAGGSDAFVAKYDTNGTQLWVHQLGSVGDDFGAGIGVDSAGSSYVIGDAGEILPGSTGFNRMFVAKHDTVGTSSWVQQFGSLANDSGTGIAVDTFGNAYVTGWTEGTLPGSPETNNSFGYPSPDMFVAKFDTNGAQLWVHQLGGDYHPEGLSGETGTGIAVDPLGNAYVTGSAGLLLGPYEPGGNFVTKYDANGKRLWLNQFAGTSRGIAVDSLGSSYLTGESANGMFLAKYATDGWLESSPQPPQLTNITTIYTKILTHPAATATVDVLPSVVADVSIVGVAGGAASVGESFVVTVTATNAGPDPATSTVATVVVPVGYLDATVVASQGTCDLVGLVATCPVGSIAANASVTITVAGTPTLTNNVFNMSASSIVLDTNAVNNSAVVSVGLPGADCTVIGSAGPDVLTGTGGADVVCGLAGDDLITATAGGDLVIGGAGVDTLSFVNSPVAVTASLATNTTSGWATYTLRGIENLTGSGLSDSLSGDATTNVIVGGGGNDAIFPGAGNDVVDGGVGADTVSTPSAPNAIVVNLLAGTFTGWGTKTVTGIENVTGGAFNDTLTGNNVGNVLRGQGGSDTINAIDGINGNDVIDGGAGTDTCSYDPGDVASNCP